MALSQDQSATCVCLLKMLLLVKIVEGHASGFTEGETDLVGYGTIDASAMQGFLDSHLAPT